MCRVVSHHDSGDMRLAEEGVGLWVDGSGRDRETKYDKTMDHSEMREKRDRE